MNYLDSAVTFVINIFFPPQCVVCDINLKAGVICEPCFAKIPRFRTLFCADCGARLPGMKKICHPDFPYVLGAAGPYDGSLKLLVHRLKFRSVRRAAEPLAALIVRYLGDISLDTKKFIFIPLPLSRKRRNERGFNQTEEIARYIAKSLPISVRTDILRRHRNAKPQTSTSSAHERRENILGCFSVAEPGAILHKDVVLLDDVTTSGATLEEAARALKAAGARKIIGLAVAKA